MYAQAFTRGNIDDVCACFSPDAVIHDVADGGLVSVRIVWARVISAFHPSLEIDELCSADSVVVVRYHERGTFVAPFCGIVPTGRRYEITAIHWFEIDAGLIVRRWGTRNTVSMSRQLGIVPNDEYAA
jgi:predicted ester cyclase